MAHLNASDTVGTNNEQSRRAFLARAATFAGAAGVASLVSSAGSARGATAMLPENLSARERAPLGENDPVHLGVIGTGGMGTGHCQAIMALTSATRCNVRIAALADVCKPRLDAAASECNKGQAGRFPEVETYNDYKELLARDDLHAVLIATPEHWHAQMAIDAILAGKDVYLEKPMTLNLEDALALYRVAKANPQQILQVGTQMIQLPKYQHAMRLIKEGAIGKPVWSQTSYCRNSREGEWLYYAIDPSWEPGVNVDWDRWCGPLGKAPWDPQVYARWRRYRKYSTGIIGDLLVHEMTPMVMALDCGWPTRVVASGGHYVDKAMENHDQVNLNVEFEGEHTMIVAGSTCNEVGLERMIRGHEANLYLAGRHCVVRPESKFAEEREEQTIECEDIGNDQDVHRVKFFECVRKREQPASGVELGTKIMVIVDLATRSVWDGHAYAFDPKTMTARKI